MDFAGVMHIESPPAGHEAPTTAAILLIGNELLTGKIRDENGWHLTRVLRRRGIRLVEVCIVSDEVEEIVTALRRLMARVPLLFTSGGVGPTHDDRTLEAIAAATERPLMRDTKMEQLLRQHFGGRITDAALSMADLPRGTVPCALPGWPVLRLDVTNCRIYILPGVPALFRAKVERLEALDELPRLRGWVLEHLHVVMDETTLAEQLDRVVQDHPAVEIGSYPHWEPDGNGGLSPRVHVTFEAPPDDAASVRAARDALRALVPADAVLAD